MAVITEPTERDFLIGLALNQFNAQFSRNFLVAECDIASIVPNSFSDRGYEVVTNRLDDKTRMRIYVTFGTDFFSSPYRLENSGPAIYEGLGDEVYVADISIPKTYLENGIYRFRWINLDYTRMPVLLTEDGIPLLSEDGEYLLAELDPIYQSV